MIYLHIIFRIMNSFKERFDTVFREIKVMYDPIRTSNMSFFPCSYYFFCATFQVHRFWRPLFCCLHGRLAIDLHHCRPRDFRSFFCSASSGVTRKDPGNKRMARRNKKRRFWRMGRQNASPYFWRNTLAGYASYIIL